MIGYNSSMKAGLHPHIRNFPSLQYSAHNVIETAERFYEELGDVPTDELQAMDTGLAVKGFIDFFKYVSDVDRKAKHAAVGRVLRERRLSDLEVELTN